MESKKSQKQKNKKRQNQDLEDDFDSDMEEEQIEMTKKYDELENQEGEEDWATEQGENEQFDDMQIDFVFIDPNEKQYNSVKNFVNGYLDGNSYHSTELADLIIGQVQIGTMIGLDEGMEDEEEEQKNQKLGKQNVLGFTTILNIKQYCQKPEMQDILQFVKQNSTFHNSAKHKQLMNIMENQSVGLVLNERLVNLSPQVVPILHTQLLEDLKWLQKEEPEDFKQYNLDYFLIISKCHKEIQTKQKKIKSDTGMEEFIFQKFEDYSFVKQSEIYFYFDAQIAKNNTGMTNIDTEQSGEDGKIKPHVLIYLISSKKYFETIPQLQNSLIDQMQK